MSEPIRVAVLGAAGRMGATVVRAVEGAPDLELVAALDAGGDLTAVAAAGAQVAVDFTVPAVTEANVHALIDAGVHAVVGTTGWDDDALNRVHEHLGLTPDALLAAVRFSAFVRDAVGPGPVRPEDVLGAIRWYVQAGYPPREVERFTGSTPLELRRIELGVAEALGTAVGG